MNSRDSLKIGLDMAEYVCLAYLDDLSDADLMRRAAPGINHINWQLGHLIRAEHEMVGHVAPGAMPALPPGFTTRYSKETAASDDASKFDSKEALLAAYKAQRAGTLAVLAKLTDGDLDRESPESCRSYAPTWGALLSLQGSHWMMHGGQWAVVRRQLGRPPLF